MAVNEDFLKRMKALLGAEFPALYHCYGHAPFRGLRVNTLKILPEDFEKLSPWPLEKTPFCREGYYLPDSAQGVGDHPFHRAGLIYIQEPSAMSAVPELDVQPGQLVCDLCAAPGGKSTQIAALLKGQGLLVSNEFVRARTGALLGNLERMGAVNTVVTSLRPDRLAQAAGPIFDRVLCDAPCSGEGMFRKEPAAVDDWSEQAVRACAVRQREILASAAALVKPGGILVYSTCTFAPEEDEQTADWFLASFPEFECLSCRTGFGRLSEGPFLKDTACLPAGHTLRVFPMDGGEGHFVAKFRRRGESEPAVLSAPACTLTGQEQAVVDALFDGLFTERPGGTVCRNGDRLTLVAAQLPVRLPGVLRQGIPVGTLRSGRLIPEHGLFLAQTGRPFARALDLPLEDGRLNLFFQGQELETDLPGKGYLPVLAGGWPVGFGKLSGGRLKNHYPKGLRRKG